VILLSIVIPVVTPQEHLPALFASCHGFPCHNVEFVVVNQSGQKLPNSVADYNEFTITDHLADRLQPAATARNIGAHIANGKYLFFMDDDAVFHSGPRAFEELLNLLELDIDAVIAQRGEIKANQYITHWPRGADSITLRNFSRLVIEWNVIIKKTIFFELGCFPNIGTGSPHAALSGEVFVLFARFLCGQHRFELLPSLQVAHPSLFTKPKKCKTALGYSYGAGYAVGLSFPFFSPFWKIYWALRILLAAFLDLYGRNHEQVILIDAVYNIFFRFFLFKYRISGFIDCVRGRLPMSSVILERDASLIKPNS